jgi:hypothetical protein
MKLTCVWYREYFDSQYGLMQPLNYKWSMCHGHRTYARPPIQPINRNKAEPTTKESWNKGKLIGQKPSLKLKEVWEIRIRLQLGKCLRELVLFNLAIDSKLRGCDPVKLKVRDVAHGDQLSKRAMVMQ